MSQTQTSNGTTKEKNFVIVDFLDLDPAKITFLKPKNNQYNGKYVPMKYEGKALYVRYPNSRVCPFGLSTNTQKVENGGKKYFNNEKITGYSVGLSLEKEYEQDPYFVKARELDEFFINACFENRTLWNLGTSKEKPDFTLSKIQGSDDKGDGGTWKRLLKYSYKKNDKGEREYLDYPPRLEFGLTTASTSDVTDENGMIHQYATFKSQFFDANAEKMTVDTNNVNELFPKWSRISVLATWTSISLGTYGASLKPKIQQIRVFPNEGFNQDTCALDNEDEEDTPDELPDALDTVEVTRVTEDPNEEDDPDGEEEEEVEEEEEEVEEEEDEDVVELSEPEPEPEPAPKPKPKATTVKQRRKRIVVN